VVVEMQKEKWDTHFPLANQGPVIKWAATVDPGWGFQEMRKSMVCNKALWIAFASGGLRIWLKNAVHPELVFSPFCFYRLAGHWQIRRDHLDWLRLRLPPPVLQ
jgi:hypothetical protein